jgi:hypothetical protein
MEATTTEPERKLQWGLAYAVPEDARAAWGARAIVESHRGHGFSLLPDRQDVWAAEPAAKDALLAVLNGPNRGDGAIAKAQEAAGKLLEDGVLRDWQQVRDWDAVSAAGEKDESGEHTLYEDERVKIVGNTNGSYGYLYIAGWLK